MPSRPFSAPARGDEAASVLLARALADRQRPCALFLDVDGTLLDIAASPDAVTVPPALPRALDALHRQLHGALALVSGRTVDALDRLFAPARLPAAGSHGAHWRQHADGVVQHCGGTLPRHVCDRLLDLARAWPGVRAEDKGSAVALHYRAVPQLRDELAAALQALLAGADGEDLRLLEGKMVFEVLGGDQDKAAAVRRFLDVAPFAGRRPVFLGDDVGDAPALAAVASLDGLALSVGAHLPGAAAAFATPGAVRSALARAAGARGT